MTKLEDIIRTLIGFFVVILFGSVAGAASGFVVSFVFNETILKTLEAFGVQTLGLELWHIGATLGFVGAFFKPTCGPIGPISIKTAPAPEAESEPSNVVPMNSRRGQDDL